MVLKHRCSTPCSGDVPHLDPLHSAIRGLLLRQRLRVRAAQYARRCLCLGEPLAPVARAARVRLHCAPAVCNVGAGLAAHLWQCAHEREKVRGLRVLGAQELAVPRMDVCQRRHKVDNVVRASSAAVACTQVHIQLLAQ